MQALRQRGWAGVFRRHGALILILACWAVQAVGFWIAHSPPRVEAAGGYPDESWDSRLTRLEGLSITIQARQRAREGEIQTSRADVPTKNHEAIAQHSEKERGIAGESVGGG